jgi:hypothetical protein
MTATKYVPQHFAGVLVDDADQLVFSPGAGSPAPLGEILTGIILANGAAVNRELSLWYTHEATSIYIFKQLLLPAHSTTNLDLYLPLVAGQNISALASNANDISLTMYGLRLVEA